MTPRPPVDLSKIGPGLLAGIGTSLALAESAEEAAEEAQSGSKDWVFPDEKQLANELDIPKKKIHEVKKEILDQVKGALRKLGVSNPDIGYDNADRKIVLKSRVDPRKTIKTDLNLDDFGGQ